MIRIPRALTPVELGPEHDGIEMSIYEFDAAGGRDGYRYELIEGVLHVSPAPDLPYLDLAMAFVHVLHNARHRNGRRIFKQVLVEPRVTVKNAALRTTNPQPDVAAYATYPRKPLPPHIQVDPTLVVEIVTPDSRQKGYVRNVRLFQSVPSILEYWIVDSIRDPARPSMTVLHRKAGVEPFQRKVIRPGGVYTCRRWPGIKVDLHKIAVE